MYRVPSEVLSATTRSSEPSMPPRLKRPRFWPRIAAISACCPPFSRMSLRGRAASAVRGREMMTVTGLDRVPCSVVISTVARNSFEGLPSPRQGSVKTRRHPAAAADILNGKVRMLPYLSEIGRDEWPRDPNDLITTALLELISLTP